MSDTPLTDRALEAARQCSDSDDEYYRAAAGTLSRLCRELERKTIPPEAAASYGDYLDAALMAATGSILSPYAAEKIRGYAREMQAKASSQPQVDR